MIGEFSALRVLSNSIRHIREGVVGAKNESGFLRAVFETYATRVVILFLGLLSSIIIARILGPEGRGFYALAVAIGTIGVQFGNLGLHASNVYHVAIDRGLLVSLARQSMIISAILGGAISALVWGFFMLRPQLAPLNEGLLLLSLAWVPFGLAYLLIQNLLLGIQEIRVYNRIDIMVTLLGVAALISAFVLGITTVEAAFATGFLALVSGLIVALRFIHSSMPKPLHKALPVFSKKRLGFGLKVYITDFAAFLVFRIDLFMVKYFLGAEQTGYYSISVAVADMIYLLPVVIGTILFPRLISIPTPKEQWRFTGMVTFTVAIVMVVIVVGATFIIKPCIHIFFGKAFAPSVPAFMWLLPGIYFISIQNVLVKYLAANGYPFVIVVIWIAALFLNIALNWYLIQPFGIIGASISSTISYSIIAVLICFAALRMHRNIVMAEGWRHR